MNDGLRKAANRLFESASSSGAMPRFFIGVGSHAQRDSLCQLLAEKGFEIVRENLTAPALWPREFSRHEGSHFNVRLFVLSGLEPLFDRFGDEVLKRIQIERRMFERTATWTLLWMTSVPAAGRLRRVAPALWKGSDGTFVFLPLPSVERIRWRGSDPSPELIVTSFGEIAVPARIAASPLTHLLQTPTDLEEYFWADLIRLSPPDALLTACLAAEVKEELSSELGHAVILLASALQMDRLQKSLRSRLGQEEFMPGAPRFLRSDESRNALAAEFERLKDGGGWTRLGEVALLLSDLEATERSGERGLEIINSVLEEPVGWVSLGANLLLDRPLRFRAMLLRASGMVSEAAADLDRWERIAEASGLDPLLASAWEARALHAEDLGDVVAAERFRTKAAALAVRASD